MCRNVLICFDAQHVGRVLDAFERALAPSGTLVLGLQMRSARPRAGSRGSRSAHTAPWRRASGGFGPRRSLRRSLGDVPGARRAYEQALRALEPDERHETLPGAGRPADIARARRRISTSSCRGAGPAPGGSTPLSTPN